MKFVIAPDSYKGSLSAVEVSRTMANAIRAELPQAEIILAPMADGGEGTVEAITGAADGSLITLTATGPLGSPVRSSWGRIGEDRPIAVLETANIAGLTMVDEPLRNPLHTTTRGLGELILDALDKGVREFIIGLGGSATNDGGIGMLSALGVRFLDENNRLLEGFGRDLSEIRRIDYSQLDPRLAECRITAASDVQSPLCGPEGCSFVFGPQKGADQALAETMDAAMLRYAELTEQQLGRSLHQLPGSGAAGGLGYALLAIGAQIVPGAQVVAEAVQLQAKLEGAAWVFTGEGRSDAQTLYGKLPLYVAQSARRAGARCLLLSGSLGANMGGLRDAFDGCFAILRRPADLATCMKDAESNLYETCRELVRLMGSAGSRPS